MALRVSGHLLLGVVRIYSRQARYLLQDCTDAVSRLKLAFKPHISLQLTKEKLQAPAHQLMMPNASALLDADPSTFLDLMDLHAPSE